MPATKRQKALSTDADPATVLMAVSLDRSSSTSPAAMRPISQANGAVVFAASTAAIMATGGIVGCARCSRMSPM